MRDGSLSGKARTPLRCLSAGYLNLDVVGVVLGSKRKLWCFRGGFRADHSRAAGGGGVLGSWGPPKSCTPEFPLERTDLIFSS